MLMFEKKMLMFEKKYKFKNCDSSKPRDKPRGLQGPDRIGKNGSVHGKGNGFSNKASRAEMESSGDLKREDLKISDEFGADTIMEVCLCFGNSVASTRFLLQDEFNIQTTQCDNCIIGFMVCLQQLACIFSIVPMIVGSSEISEASQLLNCVADYVYCTVCACMQTQHKVEMDKTYGKFGPQPMSVPPMQQMSRIDQPYPPTVGYPQPGSTTPYPAQGYPPAGSYPPQGYPPAGSYPPQGYPTDGYPPRKSVRGR